MCPLSALVHVVGAEVVEEAEVAEEVEEAEVAEEVEGGLVGGKVG